MVFVLLLVSFIPQANQEIGQRANIQTSSLEIQSMTSTLLHGSSYSDASGAPMKDSKAISYLVCGRDTSTGWLEILNQQEYIDTGTPQIPSYYEYSINFESDPANCESGETNYWNAPESPIGGGDVGIEDHFSALLPVRGGGLAKVRVDYGVG